MSAIVVMILTAVFGLILYLDIISVSENSLENRIDLSELKVIPKKKLPILCDEFGYLSVAGTGNFGTLLSQYATLYAFGKNLGVKTVIPQEMRERLLHLFQDLSISTFETGNCSRPLNCKLNNDLISSDLFKDEDCNVQITGELGTGVTKRFHGYKKQLLTGDFTISQCNQVLANQFFKTFKKKNVTFVGIHVRRREYQHFLQTKKSGGFYLR